MLHRQFARLVPNERIVHVVEFESADPTFAGPMTITWSLADAPGGTQVSVVCDGVPIGIDEVDHEAGMRSTLANRAAFVE